jgi:sarcosine oxidase subunit gamma
VDDVTERRSALAGVVATTRPGDAVGLELYEHAGSTILHLEGPRQGPGLAAALERLQLAELPASGRSGGGRGGQLLSIAPSTWLFVGEPAVPVTFLDEAFDVALDMSDGWTRLVISGRRSTELLAKGCALDFHPSRFQPGACAATGFARMRVIVWRSRDARFELFVGRSYALSLRAWLAEAALEFGVHRNRKEGNANLPAASQGH